VLIVASDGQIDRGPLFVIMPRNSVLRLVGRPVLPRLIGLATLLVATIGAGSAWSQIGSANSLSQLTGYSTTTYSVVVRVGYTNPGDVPPLTYYASHSACTRGGGNGDHGWQVKSHDGLCWIADFSSAGAPLSEWFGPSSGSDAWSAATDALFALSNIGKSIPLLWDGNYTINTTSGLTIPAGVTVEGINFQGSTPTTILTPAVISCGSSMPASLNPCVTLSGANGGTGASGLIRDVAITGTSSTGGIGLRISQGYQMLVQNVKVTGFNECIQLQGTGSSGSSAKFYNVGTSNCGSAHIDLDGWPEFYVFGARFGDPGLTSVIETDIFKFENTLSGGGPNTVLLDGIQINPSTGSSINCVFDFKNIANSPTVTEFRMANSHIEYTAAGATPGIFCSSKGTGSGAITLPTLQEVHLTHNTIGTSGISIPIFNLDPATSVVDAWIDDNLLTGCPVGDPEITLNFLRTSNVHITGNRICGGVDYTSNYGKFTASFAAVGGVEVMTVTALSAGFGPFLSAGIQGTTTLLPAGTVITGDSTSGLTACGGAMCTGTAGTLGVPPGGTVSTKTYVVAQPSGATFGTIASETVVQNGSNSLESQGNWMPGALTLGGYWDGQTLAGATGLLVNDLYGSTITDTARGFVKMSEPPQAYSGFSLNSCGSPGCGAPVISGGGAQTFTGFTWRDLGGGFTLAGSDAVASGGSVVTGSLEIGGQPASLVCNGNAIASTGVGSTSGTAAFASLTGPIIPVEHVAGAGSTVQLFEQGAAGTAQLTNSNATTSGMTFSFSVRCPQAN
jgi:hypothetical protein